MSAWAWGFAIGFGTCAFAMAVGVASAIAFCGWSRNWFEQRPMVEREALFEELRRTRGRIV